MEIFHDLATQCFRVAVMCGHIIDENGEALSYAARFGRAHPVGSSAVQHDPGASQRHLSAGDRVAITVMFREAKGVGQPGNRLSDVLVRDVRQVGVCWDGAALQHALIVSYHWRDALEAMRFNPQNRVRINGFDSLRG
jgi:hypothetical protein